MMEELKVSLIQSDINGDDTKSILNNFSDKIDSINEQTDIIILPEVFNTSYKENLKENAEEMDGETIQWMKEKAEEKQAVVTGSLSIKENGNFYNRLIWMQPNGELKKYDKRHLFRMSKEYSSYTAGKERLIVNYKGWKICPQICFDLRFPVWNRNVEDYDLAIFVSNWPEVRAFAWKTLLAARAIENQSYVVGVNRVGEDKKGEKYSGDSMVIDPKGHPIFFASNTKLIQTITLKKNSIIETREQLPFLQERENFKILV